ncbi:hypothetical protein E2562_015689 [Oryza meyeriana var. granulata]|uniref:Pentacotripeptide-repeat region of PRORP domain-containing protein n=1 Tax=Oryza meyeriana var. granulata TaxID=110450 RepID=A0A6G1D487_9ORYZ|nr:hypothetical protein E2562_015689 [Oryza meyeriana var. granulata]
MLTFIADIVYSVCKLPDVAKKVIKQAEHRYGISRTERCCELLVIAYYRRGMLFDACRVWNRMERRGLEPGATTYKEIVVTLFKNNRVSNAMKVFNGMRRRGLQMVARAGATAWWCHGCAKKGGCGARTWCSPKW